MPAIMTYASPVDDYVKVKIPDAYRSYSFRVVLVPVVTTKHCEISARKSVRRQARKTGADFARAWGHMGVTEGELDLSRRDEPLRELAFA